MIGNPTVVNTIISPKEDIRIYTPSYDLSLSSVENVASDIKDHYPADFFIIETHLQIGNAALSENAGIKLLKMLRLHHINSHVVLYSWQSREMLMGDMRNAIVFSKGVSFHRLPEFLNDVQCLDFEKLAQETANEGELLQLFRAEYNPDDRHFNANKFGVWHLMRVHDAYEKWIRRDVSRPSDDKLRRNINDYLNSYNGKLLQFIGGKRAENLEERIQKLTKIYDEKARLDKLKHAEDSIKAIDEEIKKFTIRIETVKELRESYTDKRPTAGGFFQKKTMADEQVMSLIEDEISEYEVQIPALEKAKDYFIRIKNWAEAPSDTPSTTRIDANKFENCTFKTIKTALEERKPRIVYVDDMADKGWANILQRIIYKEEADYEQMVTFVPRENDTIQEIADKISGIENPDLIILDLRLKDEQGYYDPADLSGFQVLQELNKRNLGCAILILTASNKVWSLKEAFKGNVMSYWTKSGIGADETEDSVSNYFDLICQIKHLTDYTWMFQLIAKLEKTQRQVENSQKPFWWEKKHLAYKKGEKRYFRELTPKKDIVKLLNDAIQTALKDMRQMFFFDHSDTSRSLMLNTFVLRVSDILEIIHLYNERDADYITLACRMKAKKTTNDLLKTRNISAHSGFIEQDWGKIEGFVSFVIGYVLKEPMELQGVTEINIPYTEKTNNKVSNESQNITENAVSPKTEENKTIFNNGNQLTPLADRRTLLQQGKKITVDVVNIQQHNDFGYFYNFYYDETQSTIGVLLYTDNERHREFIDKIEKGDIIQVRQYDTATNGLPRFKITRYYKRDEWNNTLNSAQEQ